ncbi:hypothetical protein HGP16_32500 [Rhizobium sp. P40RR-XXII]|uniref:PepSY domain-containing protein n=1 Tax=unclassified Rhizobium TaxID=2613769 RepID=UPI0014568A43|nr:MULTISPECIES: hypothetical protein [unclassified Rhizobium]NLR89357.1 hypothetical protein [Rhizobium sp. P28RR-XV]NLS21221.1 hypothetical protein [Rhizobium sp. P40RR-XXII]
MPFRSPRAFAWFTAVALALQLPVLVHAQEAVNGSLDVGYVEIADAGESEGSSDQGTGATASNSDASDGDADSDDSEDDQPSGREESGRNDAGAELDGPNGALKAVQADQALPLEGIVAIARHLTDGQIIDTRLRPVKGVLQYELKVLETNNEVRRYSFNARTGKLIRVR